MGKVGSSNVYEPYTAVRIYQLARNGLTDVEIAKVIGVTPLTFHRWKKNKPEVLKAIEEGRKKTKGQGSLKAFYYDRLPKKLKRVWKELHRLKKEKNAFNRMELYGTKLGERERQRLYLYALHCNNFNHSKARSMTGVPLETVKEWLRFDPEFSNLMDEMESVKDDFYEEALYRAVKRKELPAIIAAAKMKLGKRGYSQKTEVEVKGAVAHVHGAVSLEDLDLDLNTKRKLLDRLRSKSQAALPAHEEGIQDAEIISVRKNKEDK